ncbi:hypothetical protein SADUNF_Sadunf14G0141300 [Salix dunnii]|uniref:Uncharacterized protein n=1 Tax=Salix dunnii TaxID=1413687 RepID=A0A835JHF6_9ROSI|nr:hypothetical protein SADUNF_Sadunf14G0141300 [Salix dunnii]
MIQRGASVVAAVVFLSCKKTREKVSGRGRERKQVAPEDILTEIASYEQILKVFKFEVDVTKKVNILKRINRINLIKLEGVCENRGCF